MDPFIGKAMAFSSTSSLATDLKKEVGKRWSPQAICYHLDSKMGHVVGTLMRKSRGIGKRKDGDINYDVAWEFSSLGETLVPYSLILEAHMVANKLMKSRAKMKKNSIQSPTKLDLQTINKLVKLRDKLSAV